MTNITLFDAAQAVREAVNQIDQETGEVAESYAESRELFQNKAVACVAYAKEEAATLASAKAMIKDMQAKVEAREQRLERDREEPEGDRHHRSETRAGPVQRQAVPGAR